MRGRTGLAPRRRSWWPYLFVASRRRGHRRSGSSSRSCPSCATASTPAPSTDLQFVGLGNFKALLTDDVFVRAVTNNLRLLLTVPLMTVLALLVAVVLHDGVKRLARPPQGGLLSLHPARSRDRPRVQRPPAVQRRPQPGTACASVSTSWPRTGSAPPTWRSGRSAGSWSGSSWASAWSCSSRRCCRCPHEVIEAARARRRVLVAAPDPGADPPAAQHHRVLRRDRGDHRAVVGVHLRVRRHRRRARPTPPRSWSSTSGATVSRRVRSVWPTRRPSSSWCWPPC